MNFELEPIFFENRYYLRCADVCRLLDKPNHYIVRNFSHAIIKGHALDYTPYGVKLNTNLIEMSAVENNCEMPIAKSVLGKLNKKIAKNEGMFYFVDSDSDDE